MMNHRGCKPVQTQNNAGEEGRLRALAEPYLQPTELYPTGLISEPGPASRGVRQGDDAPSPQRTCAAQTAATPGTIARPRLRVAICIAAATNAPIQAETPPATRPRRERPAGGAAALRRSRAGESCARWHSLRRGRQKRPARLARWPARRRPEWSCALLPQFHPAPPRRRCRVAAEAAPAGQLCTLPAPPVRPRPRAEIHARPSPKSDHDGQECRRRGEEQRVLRTH
jgi:hypothetical protein